MTTRTEIARIRALNDLCRLGLDRNARIVITSHCLASFAPGDNVAVAALGQARILKAIRQHRFNDDPHGEHDFGKLEIDEQTILFKIDYYDLDLVFGSEDPANAAITRRVMTIMLPSDL